MLVICEHNFQETGCFIRGEDEVTEIERGQAKRGCRVGERGGKGATNPSSQQEAVSA